MDAESARTFRPYSWTKPTTSKGLGMSHAHDNRLRAEDLDDDAVRRVFHERMIEGAQKLHEQARTRLVAEGILDSEGRIVRTPPTAGRTTDDGGGW